MLISHSNIKDGQNKDRIFFEPQSSVFCNAECWRSWDSSVNKVTGYWMNNRGLIPKRGQQVTSPLFKPTVKTIPVKLMPGSRFSKARCLNREHPSLSKSYHRFSPTFCTAVTSRLPTFSPAAASCRLYSDIRCICRLSDPLRSQLAVGVDGEEMCDVCRLRK
jgi:hypothetical protein